MLDQTPAPVADRVRASAQGRAAASEQDAFFLIGALSVYAVAFAFLILVHPFRERVFVAVSDVAGIVPPLAAAVLAFLAARMSGGHIRAGWRYIGAGCLAWAAGETAWTVYEVVLGQDPFPSVADAGYLAMLPLVAIGLTLLTSESRRLIYSRPTIDGVALTLALASLVWFFALRPTYSDSESTLLAKAIGSAYPIGDLIVCYALAVALQRRLGSRDATVLVTLLAGMFALVATDVGFAYESFKGTYTATSLVNLGWPLGFLAIAGAAGLSALWSPSYESAQQLAPPRPWRTALPVALLAPQLGVLAWSFFVEPIATSLPLAVMTAVTAAAVAASVAASMGLARELETSRQEFLGWLDDFLGRKAA